MLGVFRSKALVFLLLLSMALGIFAACKGEAGLEGPRGLQGPQGERGDQGLKGDIGATGLQGPAGPQIAASIRAEGVSPFNVIEKSGMTLIGSGFLPSENVVVVMVNAVAVGDVILQGLTADAGGAFTKVYSAAGKASKLPESVLPGVYTLQAKGDRGSLASSAITVLKTPSLPTPVPNLAATILVEGRLGWNAVEVAQGMTLYGSGFLPSENVLVVLVNAVAVGDVIIQGATADAGGAFTKVYSAAGKASKLPASVVPGVYTLKATGDQGSLATIPIIITVAK